VGFFSQALMDVINRVQYAKPSVMDRQADSSPSSLTTCSTTAGSTPGTGVRRGAAAACSHAGLYGLWELIRGPAGRARRLAMFGTLTVALIFY